MGETSPGVKEAKDDPASDPCERWRLHLLLEARGKSREIIMESRTTVRVVKLQYYS